MCNIRVVPKPFLPHHQAQRLLVKMFMRESSTLVQEAKRRAEYESPRQEKLRKKREELASDKRRAQYGRDS